MHEIRERSCKTMCMFCDNFRVYADSTAVCKINKGYTKSSRINGRRRQIVATDHCSDVRYKFEDNEGECRLFRNPGFLRKIIIMLRTIFRCTPDVFIPE